MTQPVVEFRTGVRDKLGYAARWLSTAYQRGARVRVLGEPEDLQRLSDQLWTAEKESFIAHAFAGAAGPGDQAGPGLHLTPIWLGAAEIAGQEPALLLNLGVKAAQEPARYERVIEVVASSPQEVQAGRDRWQAYRRLGIEPTHRKPQDDAGTEPI